MDCGQAAALGKATEMVDEVRGDGFLASIAKTDDLTMTATMGWKLISRLRARLTAYRAAPDSARDTLQDLFF
jgi:hypothetical protein